MPIKVTSQYTMRFNSEVVSFTADIDPEISGVDLHFYYDKLTSLKDLQGDLPVFDFREFANFVWVQCGVELKRNGS